MLQQLKLERIWPSFGAVLIGLVLGVGIARFPAYLALPLVAVLAIVYALQMVKQPHWTAISFWLAFALQDAIFVHFELRGLYYPIYLLMLLNVFLAVYRTRRIPWRIIGLYLSYYLLVLFQLFNLAIGFDFVVLQRLFIYLLGLLTLFQFLNLDAVKQFQWVQAGAGLVVAGFVLWQSLEGGVSSRGDTLANPNNVTVIIALGVVPLFAALMSRRNATLLVKLFAWLGIVVGSYAVLILASRGMAIALATALLVIFLRLVLDFKRSLPIVMGVVVVAAVLTGLPGGDNLTQRLAQADVSSLNARIPIWNAAWQVFRDASPLEILFGHGFMYSSVVVGAVTNNLTSMHNGYLQMLIEYGILGLSLFVLLHLFVIKAVWPYRNQVALTSLGITVFLMMASMSATQSDDFLYWVALGSGLAAAVLLAGNKASSSDSAAGPRERDQVLQVEQRVR